MKKISALAIAGVMVAALAAGSAFAETEVKVSGEVRVRHVEQINYDLDSDKSADKNTTSQRTRINVDAKVNETTKAFVSLQDTRNWGSEASTASTGDETITQNATKDITATGQAVDVSQAYIQFDKLAGQALSAKLGRQILAYGDQRLIGGFEWSDNARRFDAIKLAYSQEVVNVDFFMANVKEAGAPSATTPVSGDGQFNGIYATLKTIPMHKALDLYLLQKTNSTTTFGQNILTYGLRLDGGVAGIDWTAEYAMQGGDHDASTTKEASMLAVKAGYTLADIMGLRIGAEYDTATGANGTTSTNENFDNLYPTNHPLYGVTDLANTTSGFDTNSISNLTAYCINVGIKPADGLRLLAEYWDYSATEVAAGADDHIGTEMNLQAWYAVSSNVDLHGFIARFTPDITNADPADNVTLQVAVKF